MKALPILPKTLKLQHGTLYAKQDGLSFNFVKICEPDEITKLAAWLNMQQVAKP